MTFPFTDVPGNKMSTAETWEQFGRYFRDIFSGDLFPLPVFDVNLIFYDKRTSLTIYAYGIMNLIDDLPSNSALGADKITSRLFKIGKNGCSTRLLDLPTIARLL